MQFLVNFVYDGVQNSVYLLLYKLYIAMFNTTTTRKFIIKLQIKDKFCCLTKKVTFEAHILHVAMRKKNIKLCFLKLRQ